MGLRLNGITLIERVETLQLPKPCVEVLIISEHGLTETSALELLQLVYQHITDGTDLAYESEAGPQEDCLTERATVGEFRKLQFDNGNAIELCFAWVDIVCQGQPLCHIFRGSEAVCQMQ